MSSQALGVFTLIVWGLRILIPASITFATAYLDPTDLMNRINNERSKRFITTLNTNDKLITAAQGKSDDMLHRSYFSHIDPDGNYVWPRIEAAGYKPYITLGENLAMDFTTPDDLIAAWMNSPTHRANILNDKFEDQGLALSTGLYEPNHTSTLVASLFGTLAKTPTPSNNTSISSSTATTPTNTKTTTGTTSPVTINNDASISVTNVSGQTLVNLDVVVNGNPALVTAKLATQSISLLPKDNSHFIGKFTFDSSEILNGDSITVEARDSAGNKVTSNIAISGINQQVSSANAATQTPSQIPISQEAELVKILRIIFGLLSVVYLGFLVTDAIIIHRAKIQRPGMHITPQIVVFILIAAINLFAGKF
jgi:hypothetical protein